MLGHWRRPPQAGGLCQVRVPPGGQLGATDIPEGEELRLLRPTGPLGGLSHPGPPSCASPCALGWPRADHAFSRELATNRRTVAGGPALGGSGICSPAPVPGSAEGHPPHGTRDTYRGGWKPDGRAGRWAKGRLKTQGRRGGSFHPGLPGPAARSGARRAPGPALPFPTAPALAVRTLWSSEDDAGCADGQETEAWGLEPHPWEARPPLSYRPPGTPVPSPVPPSGATQALKVLRSGCWTQGGCWARGREAATPSGESLKLSK